MGNSEKNISLPTNLSLHEVAQLFRIEKSERLNVMRILIKFEEKLKISLDFDVYNFYAVISQENLQKALGLKKLPESFLTVKEAAQELNCAQNTIRNLIKKEKLRNYTEDVEKVRDLLHPEEVRKLKIRSQRAVKLHPLPKKIKREEFLSDKPETEEEKRQREIEIAKIKAKVESYPALERKEFMRRG